MNNWYCTKCHVNNAGEVSRCSFCGAPKPGELVNSRDSEEDNRLSKALHEVIEKLTPFQKRSMWAWLENNVL